jgi:DNA-binding transcriptional ArsR family regulator
MIRAASDDEVTGMERGRSHDALNHPVRRQILRILIDSGRPLAPAEIVAAGLPYASLSTVAYHARVLEQSGGVNRSGGEPPRRYTTELAADPEVVALLEATRRTDEAGD